MLCPASCARARRRGLRRVAIPLLAVVLTAAFAVPSPATAAEEPGWHVIRPGDTLESLAARYLGDRRLWSEIVHLNPQAIADPHWIYPGRRIRVRRETPSGLSNARVIALSRSVDAQPAPIDWRPALTGDLLLERDAVRTGEGSSARLLFDDGTAATVSEASLVFLRRGTRADAPAPRKEIEIRAGQADLEARAPAGLLTPEIEIVTPAARTVSRPDAEGRSRSRARQADGAARIMVYGGSAEVSAAGRTVALATGTGSVVPEGAAPGAAESLLPAPRLVEPLADGELGRDEPVLSWEAVPAAASYVVEVCGDPDCGSLRERRAGLSATTLSLDEPLSDGVGYWRVTAVAASGLDGFPSPARGFVAVDAVRPPVPTIAILGGDGAPLPAGSCLAAGPEVRVRALDARGQPLASRLELDGEPIGRQALAELLENGEHRLTAIAIDDRGRTSASEAMAFRLDLVSPSVELPPTLGAAARPAEKSSRRRRVRRPEPPADQAIGACSVALEARVAGGAWLPVPCDAAANAGLELAVAGDSATVDLRSLGASLRIGEMVDVAREAPFAVALGDAGCGLESVSVRVAASPYRLAGGRPILEVVARDAAGRETVAHWHLGRR